MTLYAHVTAGTVDAVGTPPSTAYAAGRWWDLRTLDPAALTVSPSLPMGWPPRPDDTATTTWDAGWTVTGTTVTRTWTERPKTTAELAAQAAVTVRVGDRTSTAGLLDKITADIGQGTDTWATKQSWKSLSGVTRNSVTTVSGVMQIIVWMVPAILRIARMVRKLARQELGVTDADASDAT